MATGHLRVRFCTAEMPSQGVLTDTRFKKIFVTVNPPYEFDGPILIMNQSLVESLLGKIDDIKTSITDQQYRELLSDLSAMYHKTTKSFRVCFQNKTVREALELLFDPEELIEVKYRDKDFDGYAIMCSDDLEKIEATDFLEDPSFIVAGSPTVFFSPSAHA
tara:strand:- start:33 stop:518 length:486 start_codon:yes stop_codon:yes gene_type:complete